MKTLYNISMGAMRAGLQVASRFNSKIARMTRGHRQTLGRLHAILSRGSGPVVWVHAASLGEFEQGRPLIERLKAEHPQVRVVLSFFSPSGYEVRKDWPLADAVVYLPVDTAANARAFIDAVKPAVAIFVKYEFWANYLDVLRRRGVPTYIISAIFRPGQTFFKPWGGLWRNMLRCFTHLYVQDDASRRLLAGIGIDNVSVAGDTRFDRVADVRSRKCAIEGVGEAMQGAALRFIAGSSWPADEEVYLPWLDSRDDVKFIIAPHEFDAERLERLVARLPRRKVMLLSQWQREGSPKDVDGLIVDCFGHLSSLYRYGDVAYVGGGFGTGIHNINEAAVYGMPVIFGPEHRKFREAAGLMAAGGGFEVDGATSFMALMAKLMADADKLRDASQAAERYIAENMGATDKIYDSIFGADHCSPRYIS